MPAIQCARRFAWQAMLVLGASIAGYGHAATPSTFGNTVGNTLLCLNQLNSSFFYDYFQQAFGKPYKREGGAYWFKADANLWGAPVTDVLVNDEASNFSFIAAVADVTPEQLDEAVGNVMGIHHQKIEAGQTPTRQAFPGSQIIYFKKKSKIFCAKSKWLPPN